MEFRILGPLEVASDDEALEVHGAKARALLALFLVHANQVVAPDRLIDDLWEGAPPNSATPTLQTYVSQLRKSLPLASLVTRPAGYVLEVAPGDVDARRFEDAFAEVSRCDDASADWVAARLGEALAWWRGPALADFEGATWAQPEAARLEGLRLAAIERLTDARLTLGAHAALVPELEALVEEHPWREGLWAQLMLALYRSDRQADALRTYQRLRRHLGDELGIEPGKDLVGLEEAILLQKPEVDWQAPRPESTAGVSLPVPGVLRDAADELFVGRGPQLAALRRGWKDASAGERCEVLICGEPGVGKTRLAAELAKVVAAEEAGVLYGRCDEDLGIPYQPWVEALRHLIVHEPPELLAEHVARYGGQLARLIPELAERVGDQPASQSGDLDGERHLLFGAVVGLLARVCSDIPILLVLEDLHWADKPSLLLLRYLIASTDPSQLLVVATYRPTDLAAEHPLTDVLAALHREEHVQRLELRGLDDTEVVALVEAAAGHALDDTGVALAHALHRETDGNPFFTREILRHLAETGAISQRDDGRWVAEVDFRDEAGLPTSVREVIGRRVARLGEETGRILRAAAVIGRDFDLDVLAGVTDHSDEHLLDLLDGAIRAVLVREVPHRPARLAFSHALIEHTLYDDLGPTRRQRLHRRVATALETLYGDDPGDRLGELAYHWAHASRPADAAKAIQYALRAGDHALAKLAPDDAVAWYDQALELIDRQSRPDELARCETLVGLGTAQRQAGDPRSRDTLLNAANVAERLGETGLLVRAALANNRGLGSIVGAVDEERIETLEAALTATAGVETVDGARLLATLAAELTWGDRERARALSDEALVMARRVNDDSTLLDVLWRRPLTIWTPATLDERMANAYEQRQVAERLGTPRLRFLAAFNLVFAAIGRGNLVEVDENLDVMIRVAEEARLGNWGRDIVARAVAWRRLLAGRIDEAERAAGEALQIASQSGQPDALTLYAGQLYGIRRAQGRLDEIVGLVEQTVSENPGLPVYRAILADALCEVDRLDDAQIVFEPLADNGFTDLPFDSSWLTAMTLCAEATASLKHRGAAQLLAKLLAPWRDQLAFTGITCTGSVARPLGLARATAGRLDEADEAFAQAAAVHEHIDAPIELARTQVDWARMLASRAQPGDLDQARQLLDRALTTATSLGLATIQRQAQTLSSKLAAK
jgi:DNA-binding SARP family transcriptional activator/tetratricopeptide (TPR) repeat protein